MTIPALLSTIEALRALRGEHFPILVGGGVLRFAPALAGMSERIVAGGNDDEMVAQCRARLGL